LYYIASLFAVAVLSGDRRGNAAGAEGSSNAEPESTYNEDMPVEKLLEAELAVEPTTTQYVDSNVSTADAPSPILPSPAR